MSMFSSRLVRELTWVLIIKVLLIWVLWFLFFRDPSPPPVPQQVDTHLLGQMKSN